MPPDGRAALPINRKAIYSVIFGGAAFACAFLSPYFAFVLAVPSVTCGLHGWREIKASKGTEGGDMAAVVGLTMGATTLGLVVISWLVSPLFTA